MKALSLRRMTDWKQLELFEREAQTLETLQHPGIPKYIDYLSEDTEKDRGFFLVQVGRLLRRTWLRGRTSLGLQGLALLVNIPDFPVCTVVNGMRRQPTNSCRARDWPLQCAGGVAHWHSWASTDGKLKSRSSSMKQKGFTIGRQCYDSKLTGCTYAGICRGQVAGADGAGSL